MRLVGFVAKRLNVRSRADDYQGTIEEGVIALIKAIKEFDVSLGYKISTYAYKYINAAMNNYISNGHAAYNPIRITRKYIDLLASISVFKESFEVKYGRAPTIDEITKGINGDRRDIAKVLKIKKGTLSLDCIVDDSDSTLVNLVEDIHCENESNIVNRIVITQYISQLKEKEQKALEMKYYQGMTLSDMSKELEMSLNGTKLLEKRALSKLRKMMGSDFGYETSVDFKKRA